MVSSGIGGVLGGIAALITTPFMNNIISVMLGREVVSSAKAYMVIPVVIGVIGLILIFALAKASMVKSFPPVVAFRKGIHTHNFRRNVLPLEKSGNSINLRLGFKDSIKNLRTGVGVGLCIFLAGIALLFCMFTFVMFFNGSDGLVKLMGIEVSDDVITVNEGVDAYALSEELQSFPEVSKTRVTYVFPSFRVEEQKEGTVFAYDEFTDMEYILPMEGRYPEHDNEVMISFRRSRDYDLNIGDTIVINRKGVKTSYIITGIVGTMSNNQMNLYMTIDGYKRANGSALPDGIEIYLKNGVNRRQNKLQKDVNAFQEKVNKGLLTSSVAEVQYANLQQQDQEFQQYAAQKQQEIAEEQAVMMNQLADAIKTFIDEYNAEKGYAMIIATQGDILPAPVVTGNANLDITEDILAGLNDAYVKSKK